jgi:polyvinyl alcohol dehydrogenase (cytochrome)
MGNLSMTRHGIAVAAALVATAGAAGAQTSWPSAGLNLKNSRYQEAERVISARTVGGLVQKWEVATIGDVTANPAVDGEFVYFPDSAGYLYKVRRSDGSIVFQRRVSDYTGIEGDFARATPAIAGNLLILGNQSGKFLGAPLGQPDPQPARVFALDKTTFDPAWVTQVDGTAFSFVTTSAIVAGSTAIVGVASNEELMAAFVPAPYWQFRFRGSVVALDVATGAIKWQTYTVPEGYYGGAIWSSTPAVDLARNRVYVTTGNNYMVPEQVVGCIRAGAAPATCMSPDNHFNSIVALNFTTGAIDWARRGLTYDAWNVSCGLITPGFAVFAAPWFPGVYGNCPDPQAPSPSRVTGPDWDFAQGPMLMPDADADGGLVGAGQKSGMFWAFRAKDGKLKWARQVAPGGVTGGLQWGSATDGKAIFVAASNSGPAEAGGGSGALPWTLASGATTTAGGWAALDARSGAVLWTTPDPQGSRAEAAVSGANGVIFGCNLAPGAGTMYALDARNGRPLWSFASGGPCNAGPSIADGMVFWGSGTFISPGGPRKVFAFGLD